jgi:hypothetical protein
MEEDPEYIFRFPDPGDGVGARVISFDDVSFNYPGQDTELEGSFFDSYLSTRSFLENYSPCYLSL